MLTYFAAYVRGSWHVVYERPHRLELVPVLDCGEYAIAEREAERINAEQRARQTAPRGGSYAPWRAPRGLYDDRDGMGIC
jgi:hypothetical protein